MAKRTILRIGGIRVRAGETQDIRLKVSESYTGDPVRLCVRAIRSRRAGPTVLVTAAIHGDEMNGTGIIHELMFSDALQLTRGTLILVPVVNIVGFEAQMRYMPDRRDLNRNFPGSPTGSLTRRVAYTFFEEVVRHCDFGLDLHTAAAQRTNYPNVRGDLTNAEVRRLAQASGCELLVNGKGPEGSLRREATKAGCPTIIFEGGEPLKIEPGVLEAGVRTVTNVLQALGMIAGEPQPPAQQYRINKSTWVRAQVGGVLRFHVAPGDPVEEGQPIATNVSLYGNEQNLLAAPLAGVVLGMTTLPVVKPGEPVCHLAVVQRSTRQLRAAIGQEPRRSLARRLRAQLATNINVSEREADAAEQDQADRA